MSESKCDRCRKSFTRGMIILRDLSGLEHHVCRDCYNKEMAETLGIDNYNDFIKTFQAKDTKGKIHVFEIQKEIFPLGIKWVANEIKNGEVEGYQFGLYAKLDDDPVECLQKLYQKIKKGLSKKYVKKEKVEGHTFYSMPEDKLVGRIEWDDQYDGEIPKIVIDGRTYTWHEVGKMLMAYEGWNLKLKVLEIGEDED